MRWFAGDPAQDDLPGEPGADGRSRYLIVSGIGEQNRRSTHWTKFGVHAFTSGCVCVAPRKSQEMLRALQAGDLAKAEAIRPLQFNVLEVLRNDIRSRFPVLQRHAVERRASRRPVRASARWEMAEAVLQIALGMVA